MPRLESVPEPEVGRFTGTWNLLGLDDCRDFPSMLASFSAMRLRCKRAAEVRGDTAKRSPLEEASAQGFCSNLNFQTARTIAGWPVGTAHVSRRTMERRVL